MAMDWQFIMWQTNNATFVLTCDVHIVVWQNTACRNDNVRYRVSTLLVMLKILYDIVQFFVPSCYIGPVAINENIFKKFALSVCTVCY